MKVNAHTDPQIFADLHDDWQTLLKASANDDIFLTWEWQSTWWDVYCPGALHILTCHADDGTLIGIAPWFIHDHHIHTIGCEDVTDYLDLIVHQDHQETVFAAFADYLHDNTDRFDALALCNIPAQSSTLTDFKAALESVDATVTITQNDVCPLIELPDSFDDYLANLDKKQRHEVRRKMRRAMGAPAEVDWYFVDEQHKLEDELTDFVQLMASSDTEKSAFLQDEQHVAFFKRFVHIAHERGWLKLNFLTIDGQKAAAYLNFDYNNRLLVYNSGLDMANYGNYSPGIVLLTQTIRYAIENNYLIFDFLRGDETYKYRMGGKDTTVHQLNVVFNGSG